MKKCICKIYMDNGTKGTGFFCKIPFPDEKCLIPVLVTNNHVINESHLEKDKKIDFTINNDNIKKKITIGKRKTYTNKSYDTTIIEIYEDKDDIKDFLELDFDLNSEDFNNIYLNKTIYVLQYPNNESVSVSYGILKKIDSNNYDIYHFCSTDKGSSGSPILNISSNKLIGIHKGLNLNQSFNKGSLLFYPFKDFISKIKEKLINKPEKNTSMKISSNKNIFDYNLHKPKKFVLNTFGKKIKFQDGFFERNVERRLKSECKNVEKKNLEGFQIFGFIEDKLYGVLEGPPDTYY